jgi:outer membrane protein assembly factor BamB
MQRTGTLVTAVTLVIAAAQVEGAAPDWPNFRGPNHDGISTETGLKTKWTAPMPLVWERDVGSGFSSFACVSGRVYTCGTKGRQQTILCTDARTGEVVWQTPFEPAVREPQGGDGPRATPTVSDGRVYVLGGHGKLVCLDAETGSEAWSVQFSNRPTWYYSGSVLIEGDLAIVSAGGPDGALVAFDKATGQRRWTCGDEPVGYATPYPFTLDGTRYVVGFMGDSAIVAEAATGREVLRHSWKTSYNVNAASPIFHDGHLFLSSGYGHGSVLLKLAKNGDVLKATKAWEEDTLLGKFQSAILFQDHLYACDERGIACVDFMTGKSKWRERRIDGENMINGTIVLADGHLFVLSERGSLLIGQASPDGFTPSSKAEILRGRCWTVPVIYDGHLYARDLERVVCFNLKP